MLTHYYRVFGTPNIYLYIYYIHIIMYAVIYEDFDAPSLLPKRCCWKSLLKVPIAWWTATAVGVKNKCPKQRKNQHI